MEKERIKKKIYIKNNIKEFDNDYNQATGIANNLKKSIRPKFINKKKAVVSDDTDTAGNAIKKFNWKK